MPAPPETPEQAAQRLLDSANSPRQASQGDVSESKHSLAEQIQLSKHLERRRPCNPVKVLRRNGFQHRHQP